MDAFLGTLVFLLPGLMLYFWLQSFGINPVVKHSTAEFTAVSVLLWIPVSIAALCFFNLLIKFQIINYGTIWDTKELKLISGDFNFLLIFLGSSLIISFLCASVWAKWLHQKCYVDLINLIRKWRGAAPLSKSASVWEEVFLKNDSQVVQVGKVDGTNEIFIGEIKKASRTFEPERNILLNEISFFTDLVKRHEIPVENIFMDTKTGMYIKVFDPKEIKESQIKDRERLTSSS
jgi:hypothetical protein